MRYGFADIILDVEGFRLFRDGAPVRVEPQVFDLLRVLVENAGHVVTKDALIDTVWGGRVVSEAAISARINAARVAVGDSGRTQAIIRTVHRRGFELVAPVTRLDAETVRAADPDPARREARQTIRYTTGRDGCTIAYSVTGSGPPLVIADRIATHLELDWQSPLRRPFIDAFARHFTLVRFDVRGSGLSEARPATFGLDNHVADLKAVIEAAGTGPTAVMGIMSGGPVALRLAADHPDLVTRLVLLNGYCDGRAARRDQTQDGPQGDMLAEVFRAAWLGGGTGGFERSAMALFCPDAPQEEADALFRLLSSCLDPDQVVALRANIDQFSARDTLARVAAPTLVVYSRGNGFHPLSEATKIAAAVRNAELVVVDSANSMLMPSDPTAMEQVETVTAFLLRD